MRKTIANLLACLLLVSPALAQTDYFSGPYVFTDLCRSSRSLVHEGAAKNAANNSTDVELGIGAGKMVGDFYIAVEIYSSFDFDAKPNKFDVERKQDQIVTTHNYFDAMDHAAGFFSAAQYSTQEGSSTQEIFTTKTTKSVSVKDVFFAGVNTRIGCLLSEKMIGYFLLGLSCHQVNVTAVENQLIESSGGVTRGKVGESSSENKLYYTPVIGVGLQKAVGDRVSVRVDLKHTLGSRLSACREGVTPSDTSLSVGLSYRF